MAESGVEWTTPKTRVYCFKSIKTPKLNCHSQNRKASDKGSEN